MVLAVICSCIYHWCGAVCIIRRYYCLNRDVIGENAFDPVLRLWLMAIWRHAVSLTDGMTRIDGMCLLFLMIKDIWYSVLIVWMSYKICCFPQLLLSHLVSKVFSPLFNIVDVQQAIDGGINYLLTSHKYNVGWGSRQNAEAIMALRLVNSRRFFVKNVGKVDNSYAQGINDMVIELMLESQTWDFVYERIISITFIFIWLSWWRFSAINFMSKYSF